MKNTLVQILALTALTIVPIQHPLAADFSLTGNLADPLEIQLFDITLDSAANITLRTYGYGGGENQAMTVIPDGGLDPIVSAFDGAGDLIAFNDGDEGVPQLGNPDPDTGFVWDSLLDGLALGAGDYSIGLSVFPVFALSTLAERFLCDDFCDSEFSDRTNFYALDIFNVTSAIEGGTLQATGRAAASWVPAYDRCASRTPSD
jgi:hypothetical protein